nr:hypothetical protein [uncultured Allomuricauda sp.]
MRKNKILMIVITVLSLEINAQQDWPYSSGYIFFGSSLLDQSQSVNYSLLQHKANGTTFLNSPESVHLRIDNGDKLVIANNGNVGIGTSNPQHKLVLNGGAFSIGDGGSGIPFKIWAGGSGNTNHMRIGTDFGHYGDAVVELYQNYGGGSEQNPGKLVVNGNLGIGTSNPGTWKLAVKGKIRAEEIKVETGWADYVFKEEYDLPTLEEVEKHIKEKGHLINIPSAKDVEENGILLGEMNKLLLEKIEELTLYTLQQQQETQELKERLKVLEVMVAKNNVKNKF